MEWPIVKQDEDGTVWVCYGGRWHGVSPSGTMRSQWREPLGTRLEPGGECIECPLAESAA